jgi:ABC-type polysaccharide/polyol phosphate transport system ATPase subunit
VTELCLRAEDLSKRFMLVTRHRSVLRVLRAWAGGQPLVREHWVLRNLSFEIRQGEKVALLGRNGAGKSTLLRILAGIYASTSGTLTLGAVPQALFSTGVGFERELTVLDNVYLFGAVHGLSRLALRRRSEAILKMAEIEHLAYARLRDLSVGQVQRLAFSVFIQNESPFLIFDEALGNVDLTFARKGHAYFEALARSDKTLLMTSHDMDFLRRCCQRAVWLEGGSVRLDGPFDEVAAAYEHTLDGDEVPDTGPSENLAHRRSSARGEPQLARRRH